VEQAGQAAGDLPARRVNGAHFGSRGVPAGV